MGRPGVDRPATADLIARLAQGIADDLLTTLVLATDATVAIAPAMNQAMWRDPATQANTQLLQTRGLKVFGPAVRQPGLRRRRPGPHASKPPTSRNAPPSASSTWP